MNKNSHTALTPQKAIMAAFSAGLALALGFELMTLCAHAEPADDAALAAADAYIAAHRKGPATVKIHGATPGQTVQVSLKRIAFDFGAGVHGDTVHDHLGNTGTTEAANYQKYLNLNFNTIATAGAGYWGATERTRGQVTLGGANELFAYAAAHGMRARLHNLLYEEEQPNWVNTLKSQAVSSTSAKASLLSAINSRISYYAGNRASQFHEIDVYNESYNGGEEGDADSYWNLFGEAGVAKIYRDSRLAAAAAGYTPRLFVNDYGALQDPHNAGRDFLNHVDRLQKAGVDAGYGNVVGGIGLQLYQTTFEPQLPRRMWATLQNANTRGLPLVLTEFGTFHDVSAADSATMLDQAMRLMFGTSNATGFVLWDWTQENGGGGQFAPNSAIYTVTTTGPNGWSNFALTPAGKVWQDRLGIQDWDGNPSNAWNTQLSTVVGPNGSIAFNGYYGDYKITVGGKTYDLALTQGATSYEIGVTLGRAGDFNGDGTIDAADYTVWRKAGTDLGKYAIWKANFGSSLPLLAVPEPQRWCALWFMVALGTLRGWRKP